jgi:hypothetical protein
MLLGRGISRKHKTALTRKTHADSRLQWDSKPRPSIRLGEDNSYDHCEWPIPGHRIPQTLSALSFPKQTIFFNLIIYWERGLQKGEILLTLEGYV